jgi:energy-coupling factor transport system permease protein
MKSRGYGLPGRTAFSIYRFDKRDKKVLSFLIIVGGGVIYGALSGGYKFVYYPAIWSVPASPSAIILFSAYFALLSLPVAVGIFGDISWRASRHGAAEAFTGRSLPLE